MSPSAPPWSICCGTGSASPAYSSPTARPWRAEIVVGADGRHSLVARKVAAEVEQQAPPLRALYYRYLAGFASPGGGAPDAAEFSLLGDEIAYVFPSDAGLTCVAVSVNLDTFARLRRDLDAGYAERIDRHRGLAPRVAAAEPAGRLAGCGPERSYVRVPHGPGWALVGDAGMHQDPWSGEGMDMAGVHATFLAEAIVGSLNGDADALPELSPAPRRPRARRLRGDRRLRGRPERALSR